ncbi:MAG: glycosyltransferase [Spirochaetes bacterium]|nr:glycosyltransferase [Spirochaetota bacterium]
MFWILDFLVNGHLSMGFIFLVYVWFLFTLRWFYSRRYKPILEPYFEKISVIIPVYNENLKLFNRCLKSIHEEHPDEIIVVINGVGNDEPIYTQIASRYKAKTFSLPQAAKRPATALGIKEAKNDILLILDSDTVLTKGSLKELLKPFGNPNVGGATVTQSIINAQVSIVRKFAGWMEDLRFALNHRAQSSFGAVGCLPGRAIAFRKKLIMPYLNDFVNEKFLGNYCTSGDDRFLTSTVLKQGYKTVLQATAQIYTNCPDTFTGFLKQQLRWARSSQRETLLSLGWLYKYPFTFFMFVTDIITPFFFALVEFSIIRYLVTFGFEFTTVSKFMVDIFLSLFAMNISLGLRQMPHLKKHPGDLLFLPVYTLFVTLIMSPLRVLGFFTMANQRWMSRDVIWSDGTKPDKVNVQQ